MHSFPRPSHCFTCTENSNCQLGCSRLLWGWCRGAAADKILQPYNKQCSALHPTNLTMCVHLGHIETWRHGPRGQSVTILGVNTPSKYSVASEYWEGSGVQPFEYFTMDNDGGIEMLKIKLHLQFRLHWWCTYTHIDAICCVYLCLCVLELHQNPSCLN